MIPLVIENLSNRKVSIMARPKKQTSQQITRQGIVYGYARVSTQDQAEKYGLDIQKSELVQKGDVLPENIFSDVESGVIADRPNLIKLLDTLQTGDTLVIPKLDRLARSLLHLLQMVEQFEQKGVIFKSLADNIDTSTSQGRLFFHIAGAFTEFERSIIKERTGKGIRAKIAENIAKTGKSHWGKKGVSDKKIETAKDLLLQGKTHAEVAEILSMPKSTIYKHLPSNMIEQWRDERLQQQNANNHDMFD